MAIGLALATATTLSWGGNTVTVCHHPPGDPASAETIQVGRRAVAAHLRHGDTRGPCGAVCPAAPAPVLKTGQTGCWDVSGTVVACAGSGQDGELQKGASVPSRFADNNDGTVTDQLTRLIWLKDANCFGQQTWTDALIATGGLSSGSCGLTDGSAAGSWRMPNIRELQSLIDFGQDDPSLPAGHPFLTVQSSYWSSTSVSGRASDAWNLLPLTGADSPNRSKHSTSAVWAVRVALSPANPGTCPAAVAATGQTGCFDDLGIPIDCAGTGEDAEFHAGATASPRFTDVGDGTVKDNLTGLVWLKDANCFGNANWTDALSAARTLASGACGLTDGSSPGSWRLPNIRELQSLIDFGQFFPALPADQPFLNAQFFDAYWSSTTVVQSPDSAWRLLFDLGFLDGAPKTEDDNATWPVRDPR